MAVGDIIEKQRVRVFSIEARQLLRCLQLFMEGFKLGAEPFPPATEIVAAGEAEVEGRTAFQLVLKHSSYEETTFTNTNGALAPVDVGMPHTTFRMNEAEFKSRPKSPEIQDSEPSPLVSKAGKPGGTKLTHLLCASLPNHTLV